MTGPDGTAPWDAEWTLDADDVRDLVEEQFPELAPVEPRWVDSGWDCDAWRVGEDRVFRIPRREFGVPFVRHEIRWLPHLHDRIGVPYPELLHAGRPSERFPHPFVGSRWVPGRTADRARPDAAARARIAPALAGLLRRVHGFDDVPGEAPGDSLGKGDPDRLRSLTLRRWEEWPADERPVPDAEFAAVVDDLATAGAHGGARRWVHGDLYARHVLVDEAGDFAGVIDWGDVHAGDPAIDLGIAWSFLDAAARAVFLEHYGPVDADLTARARLRALLLGTSLHAWGRSVGDPDLVAAGRDSVTGGLEHD